MKKKKMIILNNHFQYSDGTVRALIGLVNCLDPKKFDITIKAIYRCDRRLQSELRDGIKLEKAFGFYFKGFSKITTWIPIGWLYNRFIGGKYDIEIGFQSGLPTLLVGNSQNPNAVHIAWMHGYNLFPDCYERCDMVVCVSKHNAVRTRKQMGNKTKVEYCYNLVDDREIKKASEQPTICSPLIRPKFISVGRQSPEKGYLRLVKIIYELRTEGLNCSLVLVGDGPQHEKIKKEIDRLCMGDYITLIGEDPNPHKYTIDSDAFICSSFSEGYSTACTEAAILGIPIITTSVPGGKEIIDDCECGILTGIDDKELKDGIRKVILNPNLLFEWKNILKKTSVKFHISTRNKAVNDIFDIFTQLSEKNNQYQVRNTQNSK